MILRLIPSILIFFGATTLQAQQNWDDIKSYIMTSEKISLCRKKEISINDQIQRLIRLSNYNKAKTLIKTSFKDSDPISQYLYSRLYEHQTFITDDMLSNGIDTVQLKKLQSISEHWLYLAVAQNYGPAIYSKALLYYYLPGKKNEYHQQVLRAAELKYPNAIYRKGELMLSDPKTKKQGITFMHEAADLYPELATNLAYMYLHKINDYQSDIPIDSKEFMEKLVIGFSLLQNAADHCVASAANGLYEYFSFKVKKPYRNKILAYKWLEVAALLGYSESANDLAMLYNGGSNYHKKDNAKARYFAEIAAQENNSNAMILLGNISQGS